MISMEKEDRKALQEVLEAIYILFLQLLTINY